MSSNFSSKYGQSSSVERPDCYGDEDYYDPDDPECRRCHSRSSCSLVIQRRKSQARTSQRTRSRSNSLSRTPSRERTSSTEVELVRALDSYPEGETLENDTFSSVVIHNATLNAVQATLDTASHAWSQIPRKGYQNLFHSERRRKKKKRRN